MNGCGDGGVSEVSQWSKAKDSDRFIPLSLHAVSTTQELCLRFFPPVRITHRLGKTNVCVADRLYRAYLSLIGPNIRE